MCGAAVERLEQGTRGPWFPLGTVRFVAPNAAMVEAAARQGSEVSQFCAMRAATAVRRRDIRASGTKKRQ